VASALRCPVRAFHVSWGAQRTGTEMMDNQSQSQSRAYKELWMVEDRPATEYREAKAFWTKIGVAWENRDGSWSLDLRAFPVNGKLQMRDPMPREERERRREERARNNGGSGHGDHGAAA